MNADLRILHRFTVQNPQIGNFSPSSVSGDEGRGMGVFDHGLKLGKGTGLENGK
jgi:hypothetical protein